MGLLSPPMLYPRRLRHVRLHQGQRFPASIIPSVPQKRLCRARERPSLIVPEAVALAFGFATSTNLASVCGMPKGSKPGERRGGRQKGMPNKATIQRAALAEKILAEQAGQPGRKLGKDLLEEFATMFAGLAASFQPVASIPGAPLSAQDMETWAKSYREPLFEKYAKLAAKCANDFADFQSPRMGTVQVAAPAPESRGQVRKKFTVGIFDGQGRPAPRQITVKPSSSTTAPPASAAKH